MSRHAIGGGGRPPQPPRDSQRPSRGSRSVQSVRRKLFGDVDHRQTDIDLQRELRQCEADDRSKYNFDFSSEQPIDSPDSRYEWSHVSNDINDTEDKFNVSTKLCNISDRNIAQSSTQSAISSTPEPQPGLDSQAVSRTLGSNSTASPTPSATCAPDSQPQSSSSAVKPTSRVEQKNKLVTHTKQMPITGIYSDLLSFLAFIVICLNLCFNTRNGLSSRVVSSMPVQSQSIASPLLVPVQRLIRVVLPFVNKH